MTRWENLTRTTLRRGCPSTGTECAETLAGWFKKLVSVVRGRELPRAKLAHKVEPVQDALDKTGREGFAREGRHVLWDGDVLREGWQIHRDHVCEEWEGRRERRAGTQRARLKRDSHSSSPPNDFSRPSAGLPKAAR